MMNRLLREVRAMRRDLRDVREEVRTLKCERMDELIGRMRRSAREMLRASRGL